ncbi:MAG: dicarboxylate/amino acid:cation symporter [Rhodospirillaceae bacterium]|nr:dicarboxylate/amino acid:cation symporter [Rhodospirillaceae bacterium]
MGYARQVSLWVRVLIALFTGIFFGLYFGELSDASKWIGEVFVRSIRMLVVPIIFTTLVAGVLSMGDPKRLASIGGKAMVLYLLTTGFAICIGMFLGGVFAPGDGIVFAAVDEVMVPEAKMLSERLISIVPDNPVKAFAEGDVLAIIVFSLIFGLGIILAGEKGRHIGDTITSAAEVMLKVASVVMALAPYGVFALVAWVAGTMGLSVILKLLVLVLVVYSACLLHVLFVYAGFISFILGLSPVRFFIGIVDATAVAFSTASSSATLPVTITCAEKNLGVRPSVAASVLPLGATINMDGTALYLGVVVMFATQAFGIQLEISDYLLVALTVTLASIGTAGVPSASLFLLSSILPVVGVTLEQTALVVGLILPIDRILDMARTAVNVTGDATIAVVVANSEKQIDLDVYNASEIK